MEWEKQNGKKQKEKAQTEVVGDLPFAKACFEDDVLLYDEQRPPWK